MIITKEVKIKNKIISIENLSRNSHKLIKVKCDNCGREKEIKFQTYNNLTKDRTSEYYCNNKDCINKKRKMVIQEKYGVDNVFQLNEVKEKIKESNLELYGVENPQQNKDIKKKTENTNLKKYGVKNPFQSEEIKKKIVKTNLEKYGVEHLSKDREVLYRRIKNGVKIHYIDHLTYQGIYEKDFILKYKDVIRIENGLSILYEYLGEKKVYHSDYYLPEYNLIIEVKSSYWYNKHLDLCKAKEESVKKRYNYLMILDKKYEEFENLIHS
jgi:hypothetical protein